MELRIQRQHRPKIKVLALSAVVVTVFAFGVWLLNGQMTNAADLRNFDPGNIMSDSVMSNKNSMTEAQIQTFLQSKNACNNTNISKASQYHKVKNGRFVCMFEDTFNGESAAHIIWQAGQDYNINPQVLIVLLQKEQGLITDTWPNSIQYNRATGYGCPDTAACDTQYYGLKNQLRQSAASFRRVLNGGYSNYPVGNNSVLYNPNRACGSSVVNIKSRATSALYHYTPYQPNQSALNAGYGTGDSCGAYGNRNFYLWFTDWFGSTQKYEIKGKIAERYYATGSYLGNPVGEQVCTLVNNGCYQAFEKGSIYWTESTGAWDVRGGIKEYWASVRYENGYMGYPTSGESCTNSGCYQQFQNGRIYWRASDGAHDVHGAISEQYRNQGYAVGYYGYPLTSEICGLINKGCYQVFEKGSIYWTESTGAWDVRGGIKDRWLKSGFENGYLGYPTSSEIPIGNNRVYQEFQNGKIYWSTTIGAWDMGYTIYDRWTAVGLEYGFLGEPTTGTTCGLIEKGCYQVFRNGVIYYSPASGSWSVHGGIRDYYRQKGSEWSSLGYPTGGEYLEGEVVRQDFQHGSINWTAGRGAWLNN